MIDPDVLVGGVDAPEGLGYHVVGRVDQLLHRGAPASLRTVLPLMLARNHSWFKQRTRSFPYGAKTTEELKNIIENSIDFLLKKGASFIILASNALSITVLNKIKKKDKVIGIYPPLAGTPSIIA